MGRSSASRALRRLVLVACAFLWTVPQGRAQSGPLNEYQVKAAFLFAFTKFVEWPPEAFSGSSAPIVLGIVGHDPFGNFLTDIVANKSVNGRNVIVRQFGEGEDLRNCQILFVSNSEKRRLAQILRELKGSNVLTVSEIDGFAQGGGMISFVIEHNKIMLEINLDSVTRAHLKMSAKMLVVARVVSKNEHGGGS